MTPQDARQNRTGRFNTRGSNPRNLAGLVSLAGDQPEVWTAAELESMWKHQLKAPLTFDLGTVSKNVQETITTATMTDPQPLDNFGDLLKHRRPPIELLQWMKDFAKTQSSDGTIAPEIATTLYYTAIVIARLKNQRKITELDDATLQRGIGLVLEKPWLDSLTRQILNDGLKSVGEALASEGRDAVAQERDDPTRAWETPPGTPYKVAIGGADKPGGNDIPMSGPSATVAVRVAPLPKIPGYQVVSFIGGGGMGDVYRAVQLGTRRPVALKLMRRDFITEKSRRRFDREVELMARLDHANIAGVYDSGSNDGMYFYAMELVDGEPLDEFHASHSLDERQTLELMKTVALAVQHAHQRGVIHRDLKPSNVIVSPDGQPHVLDFGLAKALLIEDESALISGVREIVGTPAYMSPEQARGETSRIDTRTDVYSLGVMLYRLVCGDFPHDMKGTDAEIMKRISEEEIRGPREFVAEMDRELEALLLKALARLPEDRYASAGDLARDIENYLVGDPLTARRATVTYVLKKRVRKHAKALGVALIGVVLAAGLAVATFPFMTAAGMLLLVAGTAIFAYVRVRHEHRQVLVQRNRTEALLRMNEAMNRRQELGALWNLILAEARHLTDADAGTLFVRRENMLEFAVAQNQTLAKRLGEKKVAELFGQFKIPISSESVAGHVASSGKLVNLPDAQRINPRLPFRVNADFDKQHNYTTRSMLVVPVKDPDGAVMGVLQLLNRRSAAGDFVRFSADHEALICSFASMAAVAMRYQQLRGEASG